MSIHIKVVNSQEYEQTQLNYSSANFLQSAQIAQTQLERKNFMDTQFILFLEQDTVIGQAIVNVRKRFKFFKEAVILQGPLLPYENLTLVAQCFDTLEKYLLTQHIDRLMVHPYLVQQRLNEGLEIIEDNCFEQLLDLLVSRKYTHTLTREDTVQMIGQIFVKKLSHYADEEAIYQEFSPSLKRDLKKFKESCVKVRELDSNEIDKFYQILVSTGERKGFPVQPFKYFELLKKYFKNDVKFMFAYLDCRAYKQYLSENINKFTQRIVELENKAQTKKIKGAITDQKDQLQSYIKRQELFDSFGIDVDVLPLSSYLFMCYGNEVISIAGGSYSDYLNFGGSTMINWTMIQYAYRHQKDYNFYGTIELDSSKNKVGNFNYKRQFGGELNVLVGSFTKTFNPFMRLVDKLKR